MLQPLLKGLWVAVLVLAVWLLGAAWWYFPAHTPQQWAAGEPPLWAQRARDEQRLGHGRRTRFHYLSLSAISKELQLAVLVAEDTHFFDHGPIDLGAQWEAVGQWLHRGHRLRGASTITQQLAKNLFLRPERSLWRKLRELRLAFWLERHLSKARIFELYLNIIELGPHLYGVDAAAQSYFQLSAAQLDAPRAALLAAAIPAPMVSNPRTRTRLFEVRRRAVETRMRQHQALRAILQRLSACRWAYVPQVAAALDLPLPQPAASARPQRHCAALKGLFCPRRASPPGRRAADAPAARRGRCAPCAPVVRSSRRC